MEDNFEINGLWYLPNLDEDKVSGKISFSQEQGINLELYGSFVGINETLSQSNYYLILGILQNGKKVTLISNSTINSIINLSGFPVIKYSSQFMLIGAHYHEKDTIIFNEISLEYNNINEWFNITGIKSNSKQNELNLQYSTPKEIDFKFYKYEAKFEFYATKKLESINSFSISEKINFKLRKEEKVYFIELLRDSIAFQDFLTFASLESSFPIKIKLYDNDNYNIYHDSKSYDYVELYYKLKSHNIKKQKYSFDFLFTYDDIKDNYQKVLNNWFEHTKEIEPIIYLFLNSFYTHNLIFTENKFLEIIHALETFHRRKFKNEVLPRSEYKERKRKILESIPQEYKQWLNSKFDFRNEPSLKERITELITDINNFDIIKKIISNNETFVQEIVNSRNYYTHYDIKMKNKALKGSDLYYLTMKLRIILIIHLLKLLDFDEDKIVQITQRLKDHHFNFLFR